MFGIVLVIFCIFRERGSEGEFMFFLSRYRCVCLKSS